MVTLNATQFIGAQELMGQINHSYETKRVGTRLESLDQMWSRKLEASKERGIHSSIMERGYQGEDIALHITPRWGDEPGHNVFVDDGHHRIAAGADVERTTGKSVMIPVKTFDQRKKG
jgi:hypothetical protein